MMMRCEITHTDHKGNVRVTTFVCDESRAVEGVMVFRNTETMTSIVIPLDRVVIVETEVAE
jgi:hypothetical protein